MTNKPESNISILNYDCMEHIMSYLRTKDILELEMTGSRIFANASSYLNVRNIKKLEITTCSTRSPKLFEFQKYPERLWMKIGINVVDLTVKDFDTRCCTFERLFQCFPNVERLTMTNCHIRCIAAKLPSRVKALKLHRCLFSGQFQRIFDNISSTLTEISIGTLSTSRISFSHALQ